MSLKFNFFTVISHQKVPLIKFKIWTIQSERNNLKLKVESEYHEIQKEFPI